MTWPVEGFDSLFPISYLPLRHSRRRRYAEGNPDLVWYVHRLVIENGTIFLYPTMSGTGVIFRRLVDHAVGSTRTLQPNPAHLVLRCTE